MNLEIAKNENQPDNERLTIDFGSNEGIDKNITPTTEPILSLDQAENNGIILSLGDDVSEHNPDKIELNIDNSSPVEIKSDLTSAPEIDLNDDNNIGWSEENESNKITTLNKEVNQDNFFESYFININKIDEIDQIETEDNQGRQIILQFIQSNVVAKKPDNFAINISRFSFSIIAVFILLMTTMFINGIVVNANNTTSNTKSNIQTIAFNNFTFKTPQIVKSIKNEQEFALDDNAIIRINSGTLVKLDYNNKDKIRILNLKSGNLWVNIFKASFKKSTAIYLPNLIIRPQSVGNFNVNFNPKTQKIIINTFQNRINMDIYDSAYLEKIRSISLPPYSHSSFISSQLSPQLGDIFFSKLDSELKISSIIHYLKQGFSASETDQWFATNIASDNKIFGKINKELLQNAQFMLQSISPEILMAQNNSSNNFDKFVFINKKRELLIWDYARQNFYAGIINLNNQKRMRFLHNMIQFKRQALKFSQISNTNALIVKNFIRSKYLQMSFILPADRLYEAKEKTRSFLAELDIDNNWETRKIVEKTDELILLALQRGQNGDIINFLKQQNSAVVLYLNANQQDYKSRLNLFENQRKMILSLMSFSDFTTINLKKSILAHNILYKLETREMELIAKNKPDNLSDFQLDIAIEKINFLKHFSIDKNNAKIFDVVREQYLLLNIEKNLGRFGKFLQQKRQKYEKKIFGQRIDTGAYEYKNIALKLKAVASDESKTPEEIIVDLFMQAGFRITNPKQQLIKIDEQNYLLQDIESTSFINNLLTAKFNIETRNVSEISLSKLGTIKGNMYLPTLNKNLVFYIKKSMQKAVVIKTTTTKYNPVIVQLQRSNRIQLLAELQKIGFSITAQDIKMSSVELGKFFLNTALYQANKTDVSAQISSEILMRKQSIKFSKIKVSWKKLDFVLEDSDLTTFATNYQTQEQIWQINDEYIKNAKALLMQQKVIRNIKSQLIFDDKSELVQGKNMMFIANGRKYITDLSLDVNNKILTKITIKMHDNNLADFTKTNLKISTLASVMSKYLSKK